MYSGFLIKVAKSDISKGRVIPEKYIQFASYNVTLSTQDSDSYRDADGVLHRNVLDHKVAKVEFNTPYINSRDFNALMNVIQGAYTDSVAKRVGVASVYIPEIDDYVNGNAMYVPDITVQIHKKNKDGSFIYEPCRIALIGY